MFAGSVSFVSPGLGQNFANGPSISGGNGSQCVTGRQGAGGTVKVFGSVLDVAGGTLDAGLLTFDIAGLRAQAPPDARAAIVRTAIDPTGAGRTFDCFDWLLSSLARADVFATLVPDQLLLADAFLPGARPLAGAALLRDSPLFIRAVATAVPAPPLWSAMVLGICTVVLLRRRHAVDSQGTQPTPRRAP